MPYGSNRPSPRSLRVVYPIRWATTGCSGPSGAVRGSVARARNHDHGPHRSGAVRADVPNRSGDGPTRRGATASRALGAGVARRARLLPEVQVRGPLLLYGRAVRVDGDDREQHQQLVSRRHWVITRLRCGSEALLAVARPAFTGVWEMNERASESGDGTCRSAPSSGPEPRGRPACPTIHADGNLR